MAEIPRDPRQLARDLLAGKISIQDVAKEQARRAGRLPGQQAQARPVIIQPPRAAAPTPAQREIVVQKQANVQTPTRRPAVRQAAPPPPQARKPSRTPQPAPPVQMPEVARQAIAAARQNSLLKQTPRPPAPDGGIRDALRARGGLRQAVLMAEILGKPLGLRED